MASTTRKDLSQKRIVDAIRPRAVRFKVWDTSIAGFGLDVRPSGGRTWILNYRFHGQQRRLKLGTTVSLSPAQARAAARIAVAEIERGNDPLAARQAAVSEARASRAHRTTVADVAARYLATLKARSSAKWAAEATRYVSEHIAPALGDRPVRDVAIKDVRALHESLVKTPVAANRAKAVLSAILTRAMDDGDRPRELQNPASAVEDYRETARDRYLTDEEWPRLATAIQDLRKELADVPSWDTRPAQLEALLTLALTGARMGAILPRKWTDVQWGEHAILVDPSHKGVNRIVLGASAGAHLRSCLDRNAGSVYVFPGQERRVGRRTKRYERDERAVRPPAHIASLATMWARLTELAELQDFTIHDVRRSFATVAGDVGISAHMIGGLLGHVVPGIRNVYARRTDAALLEAATKVSAEVARRLKLPVIPDRKVLPFPKRSRA